MLTIASLTGGEKEGRGAFDELMRTVQTHVHGELAAGNITEKYYADVYLGSMQSTLAAANDYLLKYQTVNKNLEVLDEQIKQNQKQNELLELQKEQLRIANETAQYNLDFMLPEQLLKAKGENELIRAQVDLAEAQLREAEAKIQMLEKQKELIDAQIRDAQDKYTDPTGGLNKAEYDKVQMEISILGEKLLTEMANTRDTVNGQPVGGVVGKEMALKQNQADSFIRNAEIQVAKLYADAFSIRYSTEPEGMDPQKHGFGEDESFVVMRKAAEGIKAAGGFDTDPNPNPVV